MPFCGEYFKRSYLSEQASRGDQGRRLAPLLASAEHTTVYYSRMKQYCVTKLCPSAIATPFACSLVRRVKVQSSGGSLTIDKQCIRICVATAHTVM